MMINPVPLNSAAKQPRALLKINGQVIRQIESIEYVENNYYQPDSFRVVLPLYNTSSGLGIEYWESQQAFLVEILIGFPTDPDSYTVSDLYSLMTGGVDTVNVSIFARGSVSITGRDLSLKLINKQTTEKFTNLTSSQIAIKLAQENGLTPIVTATKNPAGNYYNQDYVQLGNSVSEWDLLTYLAQQEGFQLFVRGNNLYFQPNPGMTAAPYLLQAQTLENGQSPVFNGKNISLSRNLQFAKDVIVRVRSTNAKSGRVDVTVRAHPTKGTPPVEAAGLGEAQTFSYIIPGLNKQQALQRAQSLLQEITLHERILQATVPGDNILHKDNIIQLRGVSPSSDQTYFPDTITRSFSLRGGYNMTIKAKNHSTQSTTIL